MTKTNKALKKRVKITRKGKILIRKGSQIHFRAKKRRAKQLRLKRMREFEIRKKILGKYLPYK